ncbi:hypothetical protein HYX58_05535 [Candidatus Dependentiae bacterium]|nr:hypothetical protein [Candidatus Dependentiae bacterium]
MPHLRMFVSSFFCLFTLALYGQNVPCRTISSSINSCQLFNTWVNSSGQRIPINSNNKYHTPLGTMAGSKMFKFAHNRGQKTAAGIVIAINHPRGSELFPTNGAFASQLDAFLSSIDKNNYFLAYFGRIHLIVLHELYSYLMKIYTTFNMTVTRDLQEYLKNEPIQALNRKTHIINHFLNIIETQSNQAIRARMPALPQHLATYAGNTVLLNHDYGADLNLLIEKQELNVINDPVIQQGIRDMRSSYLDIFGKYLAFFKSYTSSLDKESATYGTEFVGHAITIQKIMDEKTPKVPQPGTWDAAAVKQRTETLRELKHINPPMFFYNDETIRSIKVIHQTAKTFGPEIQKVGWPRKLVQDAIDPTPIKDKNRQTTRLVPPAYFLDASGNVTTNEKSAVRLYVNIPTLQDMYTQEVLVQPEWMNTQRGVTLMLRACLGDFTALFDPIFENEIILDPCIRCIIMNAGIKQGVVNTARYAQVCEECTSYLDALKKLVAQQQQAQQGPPPPIDPSQQPPPGP